MSGNPESPHQTKPRPVKGAWWTLAVLTLVAFIDFADRGLVGVILESIKAEFELSDTHLGLLGGTAFFVLRVLLLIPLGRLADIWNRKAIVVGCMGVISVMTFAFGVARNVPTLIAARLAVGGATAGTTPASVSMVADLFPTRLRGIAMGIWNLGGAVGAAVGFAIAGWATYWYGWRAMMIGFGVVSFAIALFMLFAVREPRRRDSAGRALEGDHVPSMREAFSFMLGQRTLMHVAIAFGIVYGIDVIAWTWEAAYLQRSFGTNIADASAMLGMAWLVGGLPGTILGGYLLDWTGRKDLRWHCWLMALVSIATGLAALVVFLSNNLAIVIAGVYVQSFTLAMTYPAMTTVAIGLFGSRMKTVGYGAFSIFLYSGYAWGPPLVGYLSGQLEDTFDQHSLRYGMLGVNALILWAAWHFARAARTVREDYARADRAD